MNPTERTYRRAAAQQASPAALMVVLYDLLAEDLQHAVAAIHGISIEERSRHLKHAFLVLQLLEASLDMQRGGMAARNLAAFYAYLRRNMLAAQFSTDDAVLTHLIALVLEVRSAWQTVANAGPFAATPALPSTTGDTQSSTPSDWTA